MTTAECFFKRFNTQRPHTPFKLKCFIFILMHSIYNDSYNKETYITALPCRLQAAFTMRFVYKGHAHQLIDLLWLQLPYIWKGNTYNLFNQSQSSISHHITPLVINSLRGRHTYTRIQTSQTKVISRNQSRFGRRAPGLKMLDYFLKFLKIKPFENFLLYSIFLYTPS